MKFEGIRHSLVELKSKKEFEGIYFFICLLGVYLYFFNYFFSDMERREKVKRIYAEAAMQQSELNALDRKKKRK